MSAAAVSAIVLAGGRSSRFGRDKLAEPLAGRTLLDHAIAAVILIATETIVVSPPDETPTVPRGVVVVHDHIAFEGPLVGLLAGLRAATNPLAIVVAGDMPTMVASLLEALIARLADPAIDAVVLEVDGLSRPLPAALRTAPAAAAAERLVAAGERRLRAIVEALPMAVIDEPAWRLLDPDGTTLRDVDTPSDLPQ
ncbi:MAG: molybdenum cofactor guanylyltransferase [Chloroflexota bacterium]|nr:molybdenum cofactor guanylyltransferase [Chloroflexota bacterium]